MKICGVPVGNGGSGGTLDDGTLDVGAEPVGADGGEKSTFGWPGVRCIRLILLDGVRRPND